MSPIDGSPIDRHTWFSGAMIDAALDRAASAQAAWRRTPSDERAGALLAIADQLELEREPLAQRITLEMGKPLREARAEVDKSAWACRWYAEHGEDGLAPEPIAVDRGDVVVRYEALGVVLAIMPWNFPVWQVFRALAPSLMTGNSIVLKPAPNVAGTARLLGRLVARAGLPAGLLELLIVDTPLIDAVIGDPRVAAVTLTGSDAAGIAVATACARFLKPSVLELGGSDPLVVLADADIGAAAEAAVRSRFANTGQACVAAKRLIVEESVGDEFEAAVVAGAAALRLVDPRQDDADLGPMARVDLRDRLEDQLRRGVAEGARLAMDGGVRARPGAWFSPAVVTDVPPGSTLAYQEVFGPVAVVFRVADANAAVTVANDTPYGLSATLWTEDLARASDLAQQLAVGAVFVNTIPASDPRVPFGGIERSGWGRELGLHGLRAFANVQTTTGL